MIEYKIEKGDSLEDAIAQIFNNEYFHVFEHKEDESVSVESYIMAVNFKPLEDSVISGYRVQKFNGNKGEFGNQKEWMEILK